ncbi:hypothetical protein ACXZ1M_13435 [Duganella sp. PWIR1]
MKYSEWLSNCEQVVAAVLPECFEDGAISGWQEDYITTRLLSVLKRTGTELSWDDAGQKTTWQAFKLRGLSERKFGDIALLVRVYLGPADFLEGVAFYEAKRGYYGPHGHPQGFLALRPAQLSAIHQTTHAGHVLFYEVQSNPTKGYEGIATAVPTAFVNKLRQDDAVRHAARLRSLGRPWIENLGANMRGFNLDFSPDAVNAIKRAADSLRPPSVVLQVAISTVPSMNPKLDWYQPSPTKYAAWSDMPEPNLSSDDIDEPEEPDEPRRTIAP